MTADPREGGLPRWAQTALRNLREDNAALRADAVRTTEETDTVVSDYVDGDTPLRPGARIRFKLPAVTTPDGVTLQDETWIEARNEGDHVDVRSGSSALLAVRPRAANSVLLSAVHR